LRRLVTLRIIHLLAKDMRFGLSVMPCCNGQNWKDDIPGNLINDARKYGLDEIGFVQGMNFIMLEEWL